MAAKKLNGAFDPVAAVGRDLKADRQRMADDVEFALDIVRQCRRRAGCDCPDIRYRLRGHAVEFDGVSACLISADSVRLALEVLAFVSTAEFQNLETFSSPLVM